MDQQRPSPAQISAGEKFSRRTNWQFTKQQQQQQQQHNHENQRWGKNSSSNYSYNSYNQAGNHRTKTRDRRQQAQYKDCVLEEQPNQASHSKSLGGNKSRTNSRLGGIEPKNPGVSGLLNYDRMIDRGTVSDTIIPFMRRFRLDDAQNYAPLTSDCFVRTVGDWYYCALCCQRERIDQRDMGAHTTNEKHVNMFLNLRSKLMNLMPRLDSVNMVALEYLLNTWFTDNALTQRLIEDRIAAVSDVSAALADVDPVCSCRIMGSFYNGTSLRSSDVNLELMHPNSGLFHADQKTRESIHHKLADPDAEYGAQLNNHTLHYDLISNPVDTLYKFAMKLVQGCSNVNTLIVKSTIEDLNRKSPTLVLLHQPTQVTLEITCYAEASHRLACLIKNYVSMDQRALELSILVKYWAKICNISDPHQGTLTPETFVILMIHFLQRVQPPVLPCLHELISKENGKQKRKERTLSERLRAINLNDESNCDVESAPGINSKNDPGEQEEVDGNDGEVEEEEVDDDYDAADQGFDAEAIDKISWHSKNTLPTHRLFIQFLQFSMSELAPKCHNVISIRTLKDIKPSDKEWNTEIKAIEHPIKKKVNMAKNIGTHRTFEYIRQCFAHGYYYLTSMPMISGLKRHSEPLQHPTDYIKLFLNLSRFHSYFEMREQKIKMGSKKNLIDEMIHQNLFDRDVAIINELIEYFVNHNRKLDTLPVTVSNNYDIQMLVPHDSIAAVFCWLCRSIGHSRSTCDKGRALSLREQDFDPTIDSYANFDQQFLQLYLEDMIQIELANEHSKVVSELTEGIRSWTNLDCELKLFGSTVNLLGTSDSDLDICMTLKSNPTGQGVNCVEVLQATLECLRSNPNIRQDSIEPVLSARVPIIKFKYGAFDIDLSMYNQCAVHNSMLLRSYVLLDFRVAQLFYLVKRYAKACCIADASRGSLSSYAWSLLVIHFLQHSSPPVLPVLQETSDASPKPVFGVNGWNVWFNDNANKDSMAPNETTLTTLFKQFLFYYANFDFSQYVVSIRTSRLLTKFQKNWTNCMIAIEDPFELTYNLSGRLDDPMALYIRSSFAKTYRYVYKFQQDVCHRNQPISLDVIRSLFRGHAIMGSEPPFRGCRICHKIGHKVKECPQRRPNRSKIIVVSRETTESELKKLVMTTTNSK